MEKKTIIFKATHVVKTRMLVNDVVWEPGTELRESGLFVYDIYGNYISRWLVDEKIKEIENDN